MALNKFRVPAHHVGSGGRMANKAKCFPFIHPAGWRREERKEGGKPHFSPPGLQFTEGRVFNIG